MHFRFGYGIRAGVVLAAFASSCVAWATDYAVDDGGTYDLDLATGNLAADRIVFAGSGTLNLTNPQGEGEIAFLPQIIARGDGATVTVAGPEGRTLRFKGNLAVKGTLGATGLAALTAGDTALTPTVVDGYTTANTTISAPAFDVAALAGGTAVTIDGAVELVTKPSSGVTFGSTAFLLLCSKDVLDDLYTAADATYAGGSYRLGDYDAAIIATDAFKDGSTVRVAAGRTLGFFPATTDAETYALTPFSTAANEWTTGLVPVNVELGGKSGSKDSCLDFWAVAKAYHCFSGAVSGEGLWTIKPFAKKDTSSEVSYNLYATHTFKGTFSNWKTTGNKFHFAGSSVGDPGNTVEMTNISSVYALVPGDTRGEGSDTFTFATLRCGFYNTNLFPENGQTFTVKNLTGTGLNVQRNGNTGTCAIILEKNSQAKNNILRFQDVDFTLDATTIERNPFYSLDSSGARRWYRCNGTATWDDCSGSGWTDGLTVCAGRDGGTFKKLAKGAKLTLEAGSTCAAELNAQNVAVDVGEGASVTLSKILAGTTVTVAANANVTVTDGSGANATYTVTGTGASITGMGAATVTVNEHAGVTFTDDVRGANVTAGSGATVDFAANGSGVNIASDNATVRFSETDATSWPNLVGLWLDASKPGTLHALTNAAGVAQFNPYCTNVGEKTNSVARAWWYDWRDTQTTYYLYNNRSYLYTTEMVPYVNPWWQPEGGPNNGPCVNFGQLSGKEGQSSSGTPARLEVHRFGDAPADTAQMSAQYIMMVYGASTHAAMAGGSAIAQMTSYAWARFCDQTNKVFSAPVMMSSQYDVSIDGATAVPGNTATFKEGWQIIGVSTGGSKFEGLGRRDVYVGGGQMYAEVLVFTTMPSARQIEQAGIYLAEKWGLQYAEDEDGLTISPNITGTGRIEVVSSVFSLDLSGGDFRGEVKMAGGSLTRPIAGDPVPSVTEIPSENRIAWFDPSYAGTLAITAIPQSWIDAHPGSEQTDEVAYVLDRDLTRRTDNDLVLTSAAGTAPVTIGAANRRPHHLLTAFGDGKAMPWIDYNNYYAEANSTGPFAWGNGLRFRKGINGSSDQALSFGTAFVVQNSMRGGGALVLDKYSASAPYQRQTDNPKSALWKTGVADSLANGTVYVNGTAVADPFTSAEYTGGPEVVTVKTQDGTTFSMQALGYFQNTESSTTSRGEIFGETIYYSTQLSDADRRTVEAYLAWKWFGKVLNGYADGSAITLDGAMAYTATSVRILPNMAETFTGTVTVPTATALAFTIDPTQADADKVICGGFALEHGTLALPAEVTVTVTFTSKARSGTFKLASWNALAEGTKFTLAQPIANIGQKQAKLRAEADGLYLDLEPSGSLLIVR